MGLPYMPAMPSVASEDLAMPRPFSTEEERAKSIYSAEPSQESNDQKAFAWAQNFIEQLMQREIEDIPDSDGMSVLKDIPTIHVDPVVYSDQKLDIVIRHKTKRLFQKLANLEPGERVCATGNPGIGKTTSIPALIRTIFEKKNCTVVVEIRGIGHYYEFTSTGQGKEREYQTSVLPQYVNGQRVKTPESFQSLKDPNNVLIVDSNAGKTGDCNPSLQVHSQVILKVSLNGKHWGWNNFEKDHGGNAIGGFFLYNFVWELFELHKAQPYMFPTLTADEVNELYRQFGGIPRRFTKDNIKRTQALNKQDQEVEGLTNQQAVNLLAGKTRLLDNSDKHRPSSAVMGYWCDPPFLTPTVDIISDRVRDRITFRVAHHKYSLIEDNPKLFEAYVRHCLREKCTYQCRKVPVKGSPTAWDTEYKTLGGCNDVRLVTDLADAVTKNPELTLFHSHNPRFPLYDMIYKERDTTELINSTTGASHECKLHQIHTTRGEVQTQDYPEMRLWYAVTMKNFNEFSLVPAGPNEELQKLGINNVEVWVVAIPDPSQQEGVDPRVAPADAKKPTKKQLEGMGRRELQDVAMTHKLKYLKEPIRANTTTIVLRAKLIEYFCPN